MSELTSTTSIIATTLDALSGTSETSLYTKCIPSKKAPVDGIHHEFVDKAVSVLKF